MAKSHNYGLSRNFEVAAAQILKMDCEAKGRSFDSVATQTSRFRDFAEFARDNFGIRGADQVNRDMIIAYGKALASRVEHDEISKADAHNKISTVNTVMHLFEHRGAEHFESVSAVKECGVGHRNFVRESAPLTLKQAQKAISAIAERFPRQAAVGNLCVSLGLRIKEASLLNIRSALNEALTKSTITVSHGTKGGQTRTIELDKLSSPMKEAAINSLKTALTEMEGKDKSIVPAQMNYRQWENALTPLRDSLKAASNEEARIHDLRARFACNFYEEQMQRQGLSLQAPCEQQENHRLNREEREADRQARHEVSEALGHHREEVTNAYLGGHR